MEYNSNEEPTGRDINKKENSTTLEQCGWCEYASGSHRYYYCISGSCSLQKSYSSDVKWGDKCLFNNASKEDIAAIIESHKYKISNAESTIRSENKYIGILKNLIESAKSRPPLPGDRKYNHFGIDDEVMVHFDNAWHNGYVCSGYRHHDGCVSYILDGIDGTPGCGVGVPIVMLKSEYDFFKSNQEDYSKWCDIAYSKSYNGNTLDVAQINNQEK